MKLLTGLVLMLLGAIVALLLAQGRPVRAQATVPPLSEWPVVDLTQPLTPDIPIWPGDPELKIQPWASYTADGYFINRIAIGEHSGTHWGTPNTFIAGATSAEQVPVERLVMPAVVIDLRQQAEANPDYSLSIADLQAWEAANGPVPAGSMVLLWTGWQTRWRDPAAFFNSDAQGGLHWPGFGAEAARFLITERQIAGLGTDTHGADPGNDEEYGASTAIYQANGLILECLGGLEQLPPTGATVVIGGLPIQGGSGSPARVFAILPPG